MITTNKFRWVEAEKLSVAERKKRLREEMKRRRADNENRDVKERLLTENVCVALDRVFGDRTGAGTRRRALVYLAFSSEAPTEFLIETLREQGVEVYCPRVEGKEIVAVLYGDDFTLSPLGIREPTGEAANVEIDVAIVPLLAVDRQGNRLGYGGGFYDRYFQRYPNVKRIGYCFDFQTVKETPHTETDVKMDCIVTDKQIFFVEKETDGTKEKIKSGETK